MTPVLPLLCLLFCLTATVAVADPNPQPSCLAANIRPSRAWVTRTLCAHVERSATLRRLLDAVGAASLVVYIDESRGTPRPWEGQIRFISHAGSWRYVAIDVRRQASGAVTAALLAHELQHALEIDDGRVLDRDEFARLFARIGFRTGSTGPETFDTAAAFEAGHDTLRELTGREPLSPWSPGGYRRSR
jgi:hypothetical protein